MTLRKLVDRVGGKTDVKILDCETRKQVASFDGQRLFPREYRDAEVTFIAVEQGSLIIEVLGYDDEE